MKPICVTMNFQKIYAKLKTYLPKHTFFTPFPLILQQRSHSSHYRALLQLRVFQLIPS